MLAFFKKQLLPGLSLEQMSLLKQTDPAQHFLDASFFQRCGTHSITLPALYPQNLENPAKSTATTVVPVTSALDRHHRPPTQHTLADHQSTDWVNVGESEAEKESCLICLPRIQVRLGQMPSISVTP